MIEYNKAGLPEQVIGHWRLRVVRVYDYYGYVCENMRAHYSQRHKARNCKYSHLTYLTPETAMEAAKDKIFSWS